MVEIVYAETGEPVQPGTEVIWHDQSLMFHPIADDADFELDVG